MIRCLQPRAARPAEAPTVRAAFTLTELLVVIAILAILAGLGSYFFLAASRTMDGIVASAASVQEAARTTAPPVRRTPRGAATVIPDHHVILFHSNVSDPQAEAARLANAAGWQVRHVYSSGPLRGFAATGPATSAAAVYNDRTVQHAEQGRKVFTANQVLPTGIRRINAVPRTAASTPVDATIAIIDTGIDATHPDLNVVFGKGFGFSDAQDLNGHGTHVAGIAAARNNNIGVVGVAPGAPLWALKILDADGSGSSTDLIAALNYVAQNASHIQAVNLSVGGDFSTAMNAAVTACVNQGVVVVAAAGNNGANAENTSPTSAPGAVAVAALVDTDGKPGHLGPSTSYGGDDTFANFSDYGQVIDVIAPGVNILSCWKGGGYAVLSGTSMAAPHVTGLAALLRAPQARAARFPGLHLPNTSNARLTPAQVRQLLLQLSTESIPGRFDNRAYPLVNARSF